MTNFALNESRAYQNYLVLYLYITYDAYIYLIVYAIVSTEDTLS